MLKISSVLNILRKITKPPIRKRVLESVAIRGNSFIATDGHIIAEVLAKGESDTPDTVLFKPSEMFGTEIAEIKISSNERMILFSANGYTKRIAIGKGYYPDIDEHFPNSKDCTTVMLDGEYLRLICDLVEGSPHNIVSLDIYEKENKVVFRGESKHGEKIRCTLMALKETE